MNAKAKETNVLNNYRNADPEERFYLMMDNFALFPKVIRMEERKTRYKLKAEREFLKSHTRDELGVRVQTSGSSDPTADEALSEVTLDEAFATGNIDRSLLNGIEEALEYESDIRIISTMRMDFTLLEDIIEGYSDDDQRVLRKRLKDRKAYRVIAEEESCSYDKVRRRFNRLCDEIREEIIECLEMSKRREG